jgi:hypothetical protein
MSVVDECCAILCLVVSLLDILGRDCPACPSESSTTRHSGLLSAMNQHTSSKDIFDRATRIKYELNSLELKS